MNNTFKKLRPKDKFIYLWDYYKWKILLAILTVCILISIVIHLHRPKPDLYIGLVNVSIGESLEDSLSSSDISSLIYHDLLITEEGSGPDNYSYASQLKLMAAIEAKQLDIVILSRDSLKLLAKNNYLCDLKTLIEKTDLAMSHDLKRYYITDQDLKLSSQDVPVAIDLSASSIFSKAQFNEPVYLGVIANTQRSDIIVRYLKELF